MKRKIIALLVAAGAFAASATTCITDVMLVGGDASNIANSYITHGWRACAQDLDAGD